MEIVVFVLLVSATEGSFGLLHGVRICVRFVVLWWHYQRFSSCSDITLCPFTNSSRVSKDRNVVEIL